MSSRLERFCLSFLGFGNLHAPWWFLSFNPQLGRQSPYYRSWGRNSEEVEAQCDRETLALIAAAEPPNTRSMDSSRYREVIGRWHAPVPGSKLARLAELYLRLEHVEPSVCAIASTGLNLGSRDAPKAFLAELNPIERGAFYRLRGHFAPLPWRAHGFQRSARARLLAAAVSEFKPTFVLMYGWTGQRYWKIVSGVEMQSARGGPSFDVSVIERGGTVFAAIPAPSSFWFRAESFRYLMEELAEYPHLFRG